MERNRALHVHLIVWFAICCSSPTPNIEIEKRAVFLNFADISNMREKTPDIPDIRDVFEKKGSDHKK